MTQSLDSLTLGEAIQAMRATESHDMTVQMSPDMEQLFEQHDAVHILFNCSTSIQDEIAAHVWMILGTTVDLHQLHGAIAHQEHRSVLSNIGHLQLLGIWITCVPRILRIFLKTRRMKKRLAMEHLPQLKKQSIADIRQNYGIVL